MTGCGEVDRVVGFMSEVRIDPDEKGKEEKRKGTMVGGQVEYLSREIIWR